MILNFTKKFIFLSNPKCGSTSIREVLNYFGHAQVTQRTLMESMRDEINNGEYQINPANLLHISAHEAKNYINEVPEEEFPSWEDFYTFATVRNPWKKMVSYYFMSQPDKNWKTVFDPEAERDMPSRFSKHFNDFCKWVIDEGRGLPSYEFFCCDWDTKEQLVDDVFKLEEIDDVFFSSLKRETDIEFPMQKLPDLMADVKTERYTDNFKFKGNHYDLYNEETEALIAEVYKSDIEKFGYVFGE